MRTSSDTTAAVFDAAGMAATPSPPPSRSLPLQGGGDPFMGVASWGGSVFGMAELRAAASMFGSDATASSPPPSRGRDREGALRPLDRSAIREVGAR